jgi:hypothetical protein
MEVLLEDDFERDVKNVSKELENLEIASVLSGGREVL